MVWQRRPPLGAVQRCLNGWCIREGRFLLIGWGQFRLLLGYRARPAVAWRLCSEQFPALIWGFVGAWACRRHVSLPSRCAGAFAGVAVARKFRGCLAQHADRRAQVPPISVYMVGYALASSARDGSYNVLGHRRRRRSGRTFGLAYRVMFAPNSLIYSAVSPVFFGIASRGSRVSVGRFAAGLGRDRFRRAGSAYTALSPSRRLALADAVLSESGTAPGRICRRCAAPALLLATTCWLDRAFDRSDGKMSPSHSKPPSPLWLLPRRRSVKAR